MEEMRGKGSNKMANSFSSLSNLDANYWQQCADFVFCNFALTSYLILLLCVSGFASISHLIPLWTATNWFYMVEF